MFIFLFIIRVKNSCVNRVREIEKSLIKGKVKNKTPFTRQGTCLYNLRHVFTQKTQLVRPRVTMVQELC